MVYSSETKFDIIIAGAGLAGLSLVYRAVQSGIWDDQKILVIDPDVKNKNDKTWSFWQSGSGHFDHLISKSWKDLSVFSNAEEELRLKTGSYAYHTIRSLDFYTAVLKDLSERKQVSFVYDKVVDLENHSEFCLVKTNMATYQCSYVFHSIYQKPPLLTGEQYFLQHFKGLTLAIANHGLDVDRAYLMDFRTAQEAGTTFFYTLPLSADRLFVEYTVFSKALLELSTYDNRLNTYIEDVLRLKDYTVLEDEFGVIPMTDHAFKRFDGRIVHIGTIGGDTRGATGYTFTNVQKTVSQIINQWKLSQTPYFSDKNIGNKELMYDGTLLNVLSDGDYPGHRLFFDLFKGTKAAKVFAFLDSETSLFEDLMIIKSLKPLPFIRALSGYLYRKITKNK